MERTHVFDNVDCREEYSSSSSSSRGKNLEDDPVCFFNKAIFFGKILHLHQNGVCLRLRLGTAPR